MKWEWTGKKRESGKASCSAEEKEVGAAVGMKGGSGGGLEKEGSREVLEVLLNSLSLPNLVLTLQMKLANFSSSASAAPAVPQGNTRAEVRLGTADSEWASEESGRDDLLVVFVWSVLAVYGLVSNCLIILAIARNAKLRKSTSYWLILSLSFCDSSMLLICTLQLLPATALHDAYLGLHSYYNALGMFVYDSFWYSGVLHLLMMSLNRYISICHSKHYYSIFSQRKTVASIALVYLLGTIVALPNLFPCCFLLWNYNIYAAAYDPADTAYAWVDLTVNGISMVVMVFSYSSIVLRVRRSRLIMERYKRLCRETGVVERRRKSHWKLARFTIERTELPVVSRREIRLFFQFATVSVVFLLSLATWQWLPRVAATKWVGFVVTSLFFINNATNPTVYLIFNSVLRKELRELFCPFRSSTDTYHSWAELLQTGGAPFSVVAKHQRALTAQMEEQKAMTRVTDDDEVPHNEASNANPTMRILLTHSLKPSLSPAVFVRDPDTDLSRTDATDNSIELPAITRPRSPLTASPSSVTHSPSSRSPVSSPTPPPPPVLASVPLPPVSTSLPHIPPPPSFTLSPNPISSNSTLPSIAEFPEENNSSCSSSRLCPTPPRLHKRPFARLRWCYRAQSAYKKKRHSWLADMRKKRGSGSQHCVGTSFVCDACAEASLRARGFTFNTVSALL